MILDQVEESACVGCEMWKEGTVTRLAQLVQSERRTTTHVLDGETRSLSPGTSCLR